MANIALGKSILENWKNSEALTNGKYDDYSHKGYASTHWPHNLTLDLEENTKIDTIRFLLWNNDSRTYHYRLLTSEDLVIWNVHYDSSETGCKGWQEFTFNDKRSVRYIRIHCLWNSANPAFHINEIQVYDQDPPQLPITIEQKRIISDKTTTRNIEIGSGLPITTEIQQIADSLEKILLDNEIINPKPFQRIINSFRIQAIDIEALEKSIDSIRREIINPVKTELEEGKRLGRFSVWGFYIGFAGIVVSIFAILNGIFDWI